MFWRLKFINILSNPIFKYIIQIRPTCSNQLYLPKQWASFWNVFIQNLQNVVFWIFQGSATKPELMSGKFCRKAMKRAQGVALCKIPVHFWQKLCLFLGKSLRNPKNPVVLENLVHLFGRLICPLVKSKCYRKDCTQSESIKWTVSAQVQYHWFSEEILQFPKIWQFEF